VPADGLRWVGEGEGECRVTG